MIRNLRDLAGYLNIEASDTVDENVQSIARIVYKRTDCGALFWHVPSGRPARYVVRYRQGIAGWYLVEWRKVGGAWQHDVLPKALADYVLASSPGPVGYNPLDLSSDRFLSRSVDAGTVRLTVEVEEYKPTRRCTPAAVVLAGYVEGDVGDCPTIRLDFPFCGEDFDMACEQADNDANVLWHETHGCPSCAGYTEGNLCPVDPDCPNCAGLGIIF